MLDFPNDQVENANQQPDEGAAENGGERPLLDEMIARMQQEHDARNGAANNSQARSQRTAGSSRQQEGRILCKCFEAHLLNTFLTS